MNNPLDVLNSEELSDPFQAAADLKVKLDKAEKHITHLMERLEDQQKAMSKGVSHLLTAYQVEGTLDDFGDRHIIFRPTCGSFTLRREAAWEMRNTGNVERFLEDESRIWARTVLQKVWRVANPGVKTIR